VLDHDWIGHANPEKTSIRYQACSASAPNSNGRTSRAARVAVIANDIEAIDRVLDAFGYGLWRAVRRGQRGSSFSTATSFFYRNELRQFLQAEIGARRTAYQPVDEVV
jgi:hypothetical protein